MIDTNELDRIAGCTVYGRDHDKIGKAGQVYLDDRTGQPAWLTVNTGLFGTSESFVPLQEATFTADEVVVPYDKDTVKNAPKVDADGHISPDEERQLYDYYTLDYNAGDEGTTGQAVYTQTRDDDVAARTSGGGDDDAMTRSEERMKVGTRDEEAGRARLRKYVTTDYVTETVPVRREHAVLETEPITEANRDEAMSGAEITEAEHEVVLHEERPVVEKTTEPVERVRLRTEEVRDEETVGTDLRREEVDVEGDIERRD